MAWATLTEQRGQPYSDHTRGAQLLQWENYVRLCCNFAAKTKNNALIFFWVGAPTFCPYICLFVSNRGLGPWGPGLVQRYTSARFGTSSTGELLTDEESALMTGILFLVN